MRRFHRSLSKFRAGFILLNTLGSFLLTPGADIFSALLTATAIQFVYEACFWISFLVVRIGDRSPAHKDCG